MATMTSHSELQPADPPPDEVRRDRIRRRKRIRIIIFVCLLLFVAFNVVERRVFQLGEVPFPVSGNVLVFALININVILLLLMVFLVLRNLVELFFDRKRRLLGARLRTKMVISFVSLSLIPTTLLFFIATQFVATSMDYWFNTNVERSLQASLSLAQENYQESVRLAGRRAAKAAAVISRRGAPFDDAAAADLAQRLEVDGLALYSPQKEILARYMGAGVDPAEIGEIPAKEWSRAAAGATDVSLSVRLRAGELVRALHRARVGDLDDIVVVSILVPATRLRRLDTISRGIEGYRQLMFLKSPIKSSLLLMLLIVTLLIVFAAVWFGFYVASGLTEPINQLALGIKRVADGDLDFMLEKVGEDEMGMLVDSFNSMTYDLLMSKIQVEEAGRALREANAESERRRRYTEIILQNVTAGVIALDAAGRVIIMNRFAEELLGIRQQEILHKNYRTILRLTHLTILEGFFNELNSSGKPTIQRHLKITVGSTPLSLLVNFTRLTDDDGTPIGVVIVFDNLTELEKIQRMAAWREVARRIAHEVKNPLTPIGLSAQRLRKRYLDRLADDAEVLDQCTRTIINQVDALKHLVSEFSNFARMPEVNKTVNDITAMADEVLVLYREAHRDIDFTLDSEGPPPFLFDLEQIKRVLVNLMDNAVAAMGGRGKVAVTIRVGQPEKMVYLAVADTGPGVPDSDKARLFEPYFSTKKSGTGLGLAIAATVVADHGGYIRVKDNEPAGAIFIIELPLVIDT